MIHPILLLVALVIPQVISAWTNDSQDNPGSDQSNEVQVELSIFHLQISHPWTNTDIYLNENTTEAVRMTTENILGDALQEELQETVFNLPPTSTGDDASNDTQLGQFKSIELKTQAVGEVTRLEVTDETTELEEFPSCPCSTMSLAGYAIFVPGSSTAATQTEKDNANDANLDAERTRNLDTAYLDELVREYLSTELENHLQQQIAFFAEGQGFAVRLVELTEGNSKDPKGITAWPSAMPSVAPTQTPSIIPSVTPSMMPSDSQSTAPTSAAPSTAPTAHEERLQAPLRPTTPSPSPPNRANNADRLGSSKKQPSERSVFLVGAILGACFFAFALLLLRRLETKKRTQAFITDESDDSEEEIEFYPNHRRPTPQSDRCERHGRESPKRPKLVLEPDGTSLKLESDCLFDDKATQMFNKEHGGTTTSSHKLLRTFSDDLSAPSQTFGLSGEETFEIESLEEETRPVPTHKLANAISTLSSRRVRFEDAPRDQTRSDSSLFDEIISPVTQALEDGWTAFSPWARTSQSQDAESMCSLNNFPPSHANLSSPQESFPPLSSSSEESGATTTSSSSPQTTNTGDSTATSTNSSTSANTEPFPPLAPPKPNTNHDEDLKTPSNDDGSFHGSVESVDSLISSCWDPHDNSNSDVAHERPFTSPGIQSSFSSELTEQVSFYQHVSFMKWAERAKKSLQASNSTTTVAKISEAAPHALQTSTTISEEQTKTLTRDTITVDNPYLSVSFSDSTEEFDENGFKVVNSSFV